MHHMLKEPEKLIMRCYHLGDEPQRELPEAGTDPCRVQADGRQTSPEREAKTYKDVKKIYVCFNFN